MLFSNLATGIEPICGKKVQFAKMAEVFVAQVIAD
jgi:hypothetical protein